MATLIITVLIGLAMAFFATQNTRLITLNLFNNELTNIPTYIIVIGSLLVGLLLSWIISLVNDIANGMTIRGKESKIKDYKKENVELTRKNHQLELENTKLKAETDSPDDDKSL
jgi:uncharacterized integral membrane protein